MSDRYQPTQIEPKWQRYWQENNTFKTSDDPKKPKKYILDMFPYPSGAGLHVGHPEGYTATDILSRYLRSKGYAVLHPMGWDAFGLPAEQYAIETGTHPAVTTQKNISTFKRQIQALGLSYDWDREIDTTDPDYVHWTQWIFLKLYKRGLAYQAEVPVNWCPALGTVLANEEVVDGKSERGGHPVVRTPLRQWMLKITAYADRLLEDLNEVDWPTGTRRMQEEWIGKSVGAEVHFQVAGHDRTLTVFTTRADTLYGATFMVIAPEHPWVAEFTSPAQKAEVDAYVQASKGRSDLDRKAGKEKTGVFTGAFAKHPLTQKDIPIWVADYVLWGYGTGAVMGVPGHDDRDFAFARAFNLPVVAVVKQGDEVTDPNKPWNDVWAEEGIAINSPVIEGLSTRDAQEKMIAHLESIKAASRRTEYKLRDWVFSRQRYWGEPIPVYFPVDTSGDPRKGDAYTVHYDQPMPVEESELPLRLPALDDFRPGEDPAGPLARAKDWRFFQKDGKWFARETNTMPQWAGSCWYYLRFMDPKNPSVAFSNELAARWLPVDLYIGGAEHAVLHLLYARFWHKVLFDEGVVSCKEPFKKLVHQGMILGEVEADGHAYKMSKSRGNVVNPDDIIGFYGADAMRLYEMFLGPLEATKPWSTQGILGVKRFLDRVYALGEKPPCEGEGDRHVQRVLHQTLRKVSEDIEALRFNTAISSMMVLANELVKLDPLPQAAFEKLLLMVAPFAPHLAEELWEKIGKSPSIQNVPWPAFNRALCEEDELEVPVQVNGKVRGKLRIKPGTSEDEVMALFRSDAKLMSQIEGKALVKTVWVKDKILTLVVR